MASQCVLWLSQRRKFFTEHESVQLGRSGRVEPELRPAAAKLFRPVELAPDLP